jgi:hypothetical protein
MLNIWRDPQRARAMGLAGRHRIEAHFDAARMVANYEALYLGCKAQSVTEPSQVLGQQEDPIAGATSLASN